LTFGFGAGLFAKDGEDRYGIAGQRPQALVDLPSFHGDELVETRTGGDLSVQACADADRFYQDFREAVEA
jgi:deferrochelatase/peroxidase EfeB